jgi:transcriptional regulator with XRE-family HTH domain
MPESLADRGARRGRRALVTLGDELRAARLAAGLSQRTVALAAGMSVAELSRVERAAAPWLSVLSATRLATIVGLDLSVRTYAGPSALRDAGHLALLEAFRAILGPGLRFRAEVPLPIEGDQRAWDAVVGISGNQIAVEFETRLTDAQALIRRVNLKRRDGGIDRVVLVFADTRANRTAVRLAGTEIYDGFPLDSRAVIKALASGIVPASSGCAFLPGARRKR